MDKKAQIREMTNSSPWNSSNQNDLQSYFDSDIQSGTSAFDKQCRAAINKVIKLIHQESKINKVVKGGSQGKGTMLKDISDVDLVVFMNKPAMEPIDTIGAPKYQQKLREVLEQLYTILETDTENDITNIEVKKFLLKFKIRVGGRLVDVDLLPTADNCSGDRSKTCDRMLRRSPDAREFCSPSLVEDKREFVKKQPTAVKALIRMVKYWANQSLPEYLQKSYPLELLTIHMWERAGSPTSFKMERGFRCVIAILPYLHYQLQPVKWSNYISQDKANAAIICMTNPIVLDPANPINNVFELYHDPVSRKDIARAASMTINESALMRSVGRVQRDRPNWE